MKRFLVAVAVGSLSACERPAPTLTTVDAPAPAGSVIPQVAAMADGRLLLSWMERRPDSGYTFRMATRTADSWSEPVTIASHRDIAMFGANLFGVTEFRGGALFAHWEKKPRGVPDPFATETQTAVSRDGGATWSQPVVPHRDGITGQHSFASPFPAGDNMGLVWLDARRQRYLPAAKGVPESRQGFIGLWFTQVAPDGTLLGPDTPVDTLTCECCPTAAAVGSAGPVVIYRNRAEPAADDRAASRSVARDMQMVRFAGGQWSAPTYVHNDGWVFGGCPVNGPSVDADGDRMAVAWWTAPDTMPQVRVVFSGNRGESWGAPVRVDDVAGDGQVTVVLVDGGAIVGWEEEDEVRARFVAADGKRGPTLTLGSAPHHSRLPRWFRHGDGVMATWPGQAADGSQVVRIGILKWNPE